MKIVADSAIPFLQGVFEPYAQVVYLPGSSISTVELRDADALMIRTRTHCNQTLLAGSCVQMISTATIGFDHIDIAWCHEHNIHIATAAGCNARGVLQWVAATLTYLARTQDWNPRQRTLGVVGVGHVGSLVADYAAAWGFRVLCCDPPREAREHLGFLPLDQLAAQADILTIHTPLDSTTHQMINTALLGRMKPSAVVLNSSRGIVVDGQALLNSGISYVLDVWPGEPSLDPTLLNQALLATPHIAGYSLQGKANATAMGVQAIAKQFNLPLKEWYPSQITPTKPRPIHWQELCTTIDRHFDIEALSCKLKSAPKTFETIRDNYRYREEYF